MKFKTIILIFILLLNSTQVQAQVTASQIANGCGLPNTNDCAGAIAGIQTASASIIPVTDNTYDLGSASKTWRTLYMGTSRIAKTSDILRVRQDPQRLFTWDASSDTAFTWTWGDAGVTATQDLLISASTADADDDSTLILTGGGASGITRGGRIILSGNEAASVGGNAEVDSGSVAGADLLLQAVDDIKLSTTGGVVAWVLDTTTGLLQNNVASTSDLALSATGTTVAVQEATAGSACSGTLTCNGATDVTTSTTCAKTGSRIFITRTSADTDGVGQEYVKSISDATNFVVNCVTANDTATYNWIIFHEAP